MKWKAPNNSCELICGLAILLLRFIEVSFHFTQDLFLLSHSKGLWTSDCWNPPWITLDPQGHESNFKLTSKYIYVNCVSCLGENNPLHSHINRMFKYATDVPFFEKLLNSLTDLWLNWWINLFRADFINPLIILTLTHLDLISEIYSMCFKCFNLYYFNQVTFISGLDDDRSLKGIVD